MSVFVPLPTVCMVRAGGTFLRVCYRVLPELPPSRFVVAVGSCVQGGADLMVVVVMDEVVAVSLALRLRLRVCGDCSCMCPWAGVGRRPCVAVCGRAGAGGVQSVGLAAGCMCRSVGVIFHRVRRLIGLCRG